VKLRDPAVSGACGWLAPDGSGQVQLLTAELKVVLIVLSHFATIADGRESAM